MNHPSQARKMPSEFYVSCHVFHGLDLTKASGDSVKPRAHDWSLQVTMILQSCSITPSLFSGRRITGSQCSSSPQIFIHSSLISKMKSFLFSASRRVIVNPRFPSTVLDLISFLLNPTTLVLVLLKYLVFFGAPIGPVSPFKFFTHLCLPQIPRFGGGEICWSKRLGRCHFSELSFSSSGGSILHRRL